MGGGEIDAVVRRLGLAVQHPLHAERRGPHRMIQRQHEPAFEIRDVGARGESLGFQQVVGFFSRDDGRIGGGDHLLRQAVDLLDVVGDRRDGEALFAPRAAAIDRHGGERPAHRGRSRPRTGRWDEAFPCGLPSTAISAFGSVRPISTPPCINLPLCAKGAARRIGEHARGEAPKATPVASTPLRVRALGLKLDFRVSCHRFSASCGPA